MPYYIKTIPGRALGREAWLSIAAMTLRYQKALERLDAGDLEDLLADDLVYESQSVLTPLVGRAEVLDYLRGKFETLAAADVDYGFSSGVVDLPSGRDWPCIIVERARCREGLVVLKLDGEGLIARVDLLSVAPRAHEAREADLTDPTGHVQ